MAHIFQHLKMVRSRALHQIFDRCFAGTDALAEGGNFLPELGIFLILRKCVFHFFCFILVSPSIRAGIRRVEATFSGTGENINCRFGVALGNASQCFYLTGNRSLFSRSNLFAGLLRHSAYHIIQNRKVFCRRVRHLCFKAKLANAARALFGLGKLFLVQFSRFHNVIRVLLFCQRPRLG